MNSYDHIRSYRDEEAGPVCRKLFANPAIRTLMLSLIPGLSDEKLESIASGVSSILDFQHRLMLPVIQNRILPTFSSLTVSGLDKLPMDKACLFISNHRDIVLDSAILNYFLHINKHRTAEIAIGDNLLREEWISDLVRLNKSFIVRRSLDKAAMLEASRELSGYIHDTITRRNESVWIAQRAGRAKDGNDETNKGLLTMLALSANGDLVSHFRSLNIVPVTISYEFDPCDSRKAAELVTEEVRGSYEKSENEDKESMILGLTGFKGKGHIHFGPALQAENAGNLNKSAYLAELRSGIDRHIQGNYRLWPTNFIAARNSGHGETGYDDADLKNFETRLKSAENGERPLRMSEIILSMYCQPYLNALKQKDHSSLPSGFSNLL